MFSLTKNEYGLASRSEEGILRFFVNHIKVFDMEVAVIQVEIIIVQSLMLSVG